MLYFGINFIKVKKYYNRKRDICVRCRSRMAQIKVSQEGNESRTRICNKKFRTIWFSLFTFFKKKEKLKANTTMTFDFG